MAKEIEEIIYPPHRSNEWLTSEQILERFGLEKHVLQNAISKKVFHIKHQKNQLHGRGIMCLINLQEFREWYIKYRKKRKY